MKVLKQLIISSLVLLPFLAFSQSRIALDFRVSPDYTYRSWQSKGEYQTKYNADEMGDITGHLSLNLNTKLSSKIWLRTGFQLSKLSYKGTLTHVTEEVRQEPNGKLTTWSIASYYVRVDKHQLQYSFLAVPVTCRFLFSDRKISPYLELGIAPNFHIGGKTTHYVSQESLEVASSATKFSLWAYGDWAYNSKSMNHSTPFFNPQPNTN